MSAGAAAGRTQGLASLWSHEETQLGSPHESSLLFLPYSVNLLLLSGLSPVISLDHQQTGEPSPCSRKRLSSFLPQSFLRPQLRTGLEPGYPTPASVFMGLFMATLSLGLHPGPVSDPLSVPLGNSTGHHLRIPSVVTMVWMYLYIPNTDRPPHPPPHTLSSLCRRLGWLECGNKR